MPLPFPKGCEQASFFCGRLGMGNQNEGMRLQEPGVRPENEHGNHNLSFAATPPMR
jgi:hypothetical protein